MLISKLAITICPYCLDLIWFDWIIKIDYVAVFLDSWHHGRQLREIADSGAETDSAVADALRDFDETLQPGLLAIETKNPKFVVLGLSYVQRLASYDAIDADQFQIVGQILRQISVNTTHDLQTKTYVWQIDLRLVRGDCAPKDHSNHYHHNAGPCVCTIHLLVQLDAILIL